MAAGQIYQGKLARFKFNGKTLFHATNCKLSVSTKLEEIATKDTNGSVVIPGNYAWSMNTDALVADKPVGTTQSDFMDLLTFQLNSALIQVELSAGVVGDWKLAGEVYIDSSDITAATTGAVQGSFSFKGTGNLVKSLVI